MQGIAVMMMAMGCMISMIVFIRHHGRQGTVVSRAARRLHNRGKPLHGQRGYQKPKQEYLEGTVHFVSLA
jgi:hypothetical protein